MQLVILSPPILPRTPVKRALQPIAEARLLDYPILTITGPRQSGKTTLARLLRPDAPYFSLENPDIRSFAQEDPRGFLAQMGNAAFSTRCSGHLIFSPIFRGSSMPTEPPGVLFSPDPVSSNSLKPLLRVWRAELPFLPCFRFR